MILANVLYLLLCLLSESFQNSSRVDQYRVEYIFNVVSQDVEDVANSLFRTLSLQTNFSSIHTVQNDLQLYSEIKKCVNRNSQVFKKFDDQNITACKHDEESNSEVDELISSILNVTLNFDMNNVIRQEFDIFISIIANKLHLTEPKAQLLLFMNKILDNKRTKINTLGFIRRRRSNSRKNTTSNDLEFWNEESRNASDSQDRARRVYKGKRTGVVHYPFMVSVHENGQFVCSGCIIRRDLVISAASCFQQVLARKKTGPPSIRLRVGSDYVHKGGYMVSATHAIFHHSYDPVSLRNNLVLLSVDNNAFVKISYDWIKRIKYQHANDISPYVKIDSVKILGWGAQTRGEDIEEENTGSPGNITESKRKIYRNLQTEQPGIEHEIPLSFDLLETYELEECMDIYSRYFVTQNNLCAGFLLSGYGVCQYDVGGPGIYNGLLVGIVSFGSERCGTKDKPTVFTRVAPYVDWIHDVAHQVIPKLQKKGRLLTRKQGSLLHDLGKFLDLTLTITNTETKDAERRQRKANSLVRLVFDNKQAKEKETNLNSQEADEIIEKIASIPTTSSSKATVLSSVDESDENNESGMSIETEESDPFEPQTDITETNTVKTEILETDIPEMNNPETDIPETDIPKTDIPETDIPKMDTETVNAQSSIKQYWIDFMSVATTKIYSLNMSKPVKKKKKITNRKTRAFRKHIMEETTTPHDLAAAVYFERYIKSQQV